MRELTKARIWLVASFAFYFIAYGTALFGTLKLNTSATTPAPLAYYVLWFVGLAASIVWT